MWIVQKDPAPNCSCLTEVCRGLTGVQPLRIHFYAHVPVIPTRRQHLTIWPLWASLAMIMVCVAREYEGASGTDVRLMVGRSGRAVRDRTPMTDLRTIASYRENVKRI